MSTSEDTGDLQLSLASRGIDTSPRSYLCSFLPLMLAFRYAACNSQGPDAFSKPDTRR
jgi:hypothetical protein